MNNKVSGAVFRAALPLCFLVQHRQTIDRALLCGLPPGGGATVVILKPAAEALAWLDASGLPLLAVAAELQCHGNLPIPKLRSELPNLSPQ
jgi:hypothetical protein